MTDLRVILAEEIAEAHGAILYPLRCDCGWPLLIKKEDHVPYCWDCCTNKALAQRGHDLLERIQRRIHFHHVGNEVFCCTKENCQRVA